MADSQCAAHVPLSRSSEEQEKLHILSLTQLVIAELNGEHTTALMHNKTGLQCFNIRIISIIINQVGFMIKMLVSICLMHRT